MESTLRTKPSDDNRSASAKWGARRRTIKPQSIPKYIAKSQVSKSPTIDSDVSSLQRLLDPPGESRGMIVTDYRSVSCNRLNW